MREKDAALCLRIGKSRCEKQLDSTVKQLATEREKVKLLVEALEGWRTYYPNMREAIDMLLAKVRER